MTTTPESRLLVAGSTGATGRAIFRLAERAGVRPRVIPHLRPRGPATLPVEPPPDAVVCDLADERTLAAALRERGVTTIVQLIGTMRKRFARGDTYETSDVGTTVQLVAAARAAGVRHVVLLSSVGAGKPMGAYLQAKARAEAAVTGSGLSWTIFRPSAFYGEGHGAPTGAKPLLRALGLRRYEPIAVDDLVAGILHVALDGAPTGVALEGRALWDVVEAARRRFALGGT